MLAWLNDISYELKFPFVGSGDFKIYIYKEKETKGMKNEMKKKNNKGFSLVELIVVIAIMAVLMVVLAPAMLRYVEKTRAQKDASAVSEAANAAELALAEEKIYTAAGGSDVTVTVEDGKNIVASVADLQTEVQKTVGTQITFSSKKYKGAKAVITLTFDKTRDAYLIKTDADHPDGLYWTLKTTP